MCIGKLTISVLNWPSMTKARSISINLDKKRKTLLFGLWSGSDDFLQVTEITKNVVLSTTNKAFKF